MSYKFRAGDTVTHVRTQRRYRVVKTPNCVIYEPTGEACYEYVPLVATDRRVWIRPQSQMEDGRFVLDNQEGKAL